MVEVENSNQYIQKNLTKSIDNNIFEPRESLNNTAKWIIEARKELGSEVVLGVDLHHRFSVAEAASFCNKLPQGTLDFLEEPIRDETPSAYNALRKMTNIPFAIGEEFASKWQFILTLKTILLNLQELIYVMLEE